MTATPSETVPPLLLTPVQAAAVLGISRTRIFALLARGDIESVQIGRSRRVPVVALEAFVAQLRQSSADTACR